MPPRKPKRSVSAEDVRGKKELKVAEEASAPIASQPVTSEKPESGTSKEDAPAEEAPKTESPSKNRHATQELVEDVVIGYTGDDDDDPPQAGQAVARHARDIKQMVSDGLDVPIAKDQRSAYVWVAAARMIDKGERADGSQEPRKKKYTWNLDEMAPAGIECSCDICGQGVSEDGVLYEFRCYPRLRRDEPRPAGGRRLHPFVSYMGKECGKGLLGLATGASKLRERVYRLLIEADGLAAMEELEDVWRNGSDTMRQILADELRFLSRAEAGMPRRAAELRKAEQLHGDVYKEREDVFRAAARATGPVLNARDLASVTITYAEDQEEENVALPSSKGNSSVQRTSGYLGQVAEALRERKPLPAAPVPWPRADVVTCLQALVNAWHPLRIELHDSLHGRQEFYFEKPSHKQKKQKKEKDKQSLPMLSLVYLPGCQELHSISAQSCSREQCQALKEERDQVLKQCREDFAPLEAIHGQGRYSRAEDKAIEVPDRVTFEQVTKALTQITWPNCFTRNNVRPDGAPFIEAFPLGVVLNYALGLVCSRPTRLWPNLTKLLAKFIAQEQPDFRYTTVQLNKDYATKMHVDGNNHGPSYIIGLGDYTGGEVWILDEENGTVEVEIPCTLRGWPHLRPGTKALGRLEDCRNKWLKFDGNRPHMTMPYQGSRISVVFFTRKGWLTMLGQTQVSLEALGFQLPGEDYLNLSTVKELKEEKDNSQAKKVKKVAKAPRESKEEVPSDEEVDEEEAVDAILRADQDAATWPAWDWGARLQEHLKSMGGINFGENLEVACLGSAAVFGIVLQELMKESSFRVVAWAEPGRTAMRLLKKTCKPDHAFKDVNEALARQGHCEVHHQVCSCRDASSGNGSTGIAEDLLFGSFPPEPFLNQDPSKPSCFDDPRSAAFLSLREHVVSKKPRAALLLVECWQKLPEASRPSVQSFLLDGKDPRIWDGDPKACWGLRHIDGYGVTFIDIPVADCGVPLAGHEAMLVLVREDSGGAAAAEATEQLVRKIVGSDVLPRCSAHSLMFTNDDPRVEQAQREEANDALQKKGRKAINAAMRRRMGQEARDLGLQTGEAPYTEFLRKKPTRHSEGQTPSETWIKQAPSDKAVLVNLLYVRASQSGLDLQNLSADLSLGLSTQGRRDDGLLPRTSAISIKTDPLSMPEFYSFSHHRTLVGQEIALCFGYPIWRLDFRAISDSEVRDMLTRSPVVPAVGVAVAALLSVAELHGEQKLPKQSLAQLLADLKETDKKEETAALSTVSTTSIPTGPAASPAPGASMAEALPADEEGVRLESRAAALLNLVSHDSFARSATTQARKDDGRGIFSALSEVAKEAGGSEERGTKRKEPESEAEGIMPIEEPLDWQVRARKLHFGVEPVSIETVLKWVTEAVEDTEAEHSHKIIRTGIEEVQRRVSRDELVPQALFTSKNKLVNGLKAHGFEDLAQEADVTMRASQLAKNIARGAPEVCLDSQSKDSMKHYVNRVVRGCDRFGWMMRRVFLNHLSQVASRALKAGEASSISKAAEALKEFGNEGGWTCIVSWLKETPHPEKWPSAAVLDQLGNCLLPKTPPVLFALLYRALTSPQMGYSHPQSLNRMEKILSAAISPLELRSVEQGMPLVKEIAASGGAITERFDKVLKLMGLGLEVHEAIGNQETKTWRQLQERLEELPTPQRGSWQQLAALESTFTTELKDTILHHLAVAKNYEKTLKKKEAARLQQQSMAAVERCRLALLSLVEDDGLKDKTHSGLKACLARMKDLTDAMKKMEELNVAGDAEDRVSGCHKAWNAGRAAVQQFSEKQVRSAKAFIWLRQQNLAHCARLLDTAGILERLHILRTSPQRLEAIGLPYRCRYLLFMAAERENLSDDNFAPKLEEVPEEWEQRTSRHLNLKFFEKQGGQQKRQQMQWEWPLPRGLVAWQGNAEGSTSEAWQKRDEEHALSSQMVNQSNVVVDPFREGSQCLLCHQNAENGHHTSSTHCQQMKQWKIASDRLAMVCLDLDTLSQDEARRPGLASVWRGELWEALRASPAIPTNVLAVFWRRVVLPQLSLQNSKHDSESLLGLQALLKEALKVARILEEDATDKEVSAAITSAERFIDDTKYPGLDKSSIALAAAAIKDLRLATAKILHTRSAVLKNAVAILGQAQAKVKHHSLEPAFHATFHSWLKKHKLETCFKLLDQRGVIVSILKGDPVEANAAVGLPTRFAEKLWKAWCSDGDLRLLRPLCSPPDDWEAVFSRNVGLFYFCKRVVHGPAQWMYPPTLAEDKLPKVQGNLEDLTRGQPHSGSVPYVEIDLNGEPVCLLCKAHGLEHFASAGHARNVNLWSAIQDRLVAADRDLAVQSTSLTSHSTSSQLSELAKVWVGEIQRLTLEQNTGADLEGQVGRTFWHLLFDDWAAKASRPAQVQQELERALRIAGLAEPKWSSLQWKPRIPPQPDVDFPWPLPSILTLSASTPAEVFDHLNAEALKSEGIKVQADGSFWCAFCDKAVKPLANHLDRTSLEAKQHLDSRDVAQTVVASLRAEGHELGREGMTISKRRFRCGLCNISGSWTRCLEHRSSRSHQDAYQRFQGSTSSIAAQAKLNNSSFIEVEQTAWKAAFDAMDKW